MPSRYSWLLLGLAFVCANGMIAQEKDEKNSSKPDANAVEVRAAINGLFQQLEIPSSYNADQFAAALKRIHEQLR